MAVMPTITILDLPEIVELLHEAVDAVPEWEQVALRERLKAILERAHRARMK